MPSPRHCPPGFKAIRSPHFSSPSQGSGSVGFTLVEVLLVFLIVAVLTALAFPLAGWMSRESKGVTCVSRLSRAGTAMQLYIQDMNNRIVTRSGGNRGGMADLWGAELSGRGYLSEPARANGYRSLSGQDPKMLQCPAGALPATYDLTNWAWYTYGLNLFTPGGEETESNKSYHHVRHVASIANPASFVLLADSASQTDVQSFRIGRDSGGGLALRHGGKGNVLFLDGHVETIPSSHAEELGFPAIYHIAH